jgi:hypothetical protein
MEENQAPSPVKKKGRGTTIVLVIVIILLAVASAYLYNLLNQKEKQNQQYQEVQQVLEEEKNSLQGELKDLMEEYESMKSTNDSMNQKLEAQQAKIKKLLTYNASNLEKIKLYKKELVTLREIMKSYIVQIDSLNQKNQTLVAENNEVKGRLEQSRVTTKELTQQKDELSKKVEQASVLSAKNIVITALNKRSRENIKADRIAKLKVCFTVRENSIVQAGPRVVYIRIARPDELVLTSSADNLMKFQGEQVVYTEKREIEYENADIDLCIFYDVKAGELIPGIYKVDLFTDGSLIGSSTITLK